MLPSTENLRAFDAAARLLSFRAAARTVALTPAAFGQRIRQLEDQLGVALFRRTTRSVALPDPGLALLPEAPLRRSPLARPADAARHTLIDAAPELPLFRYWRDGPSGARPRPELRFRDVLAAGSTEAIRRLVLASEGVAVLPEYLVRRDV